MLLEREAAGRPVTVGLIGAGKFGTMFLAQARLTRGMHVVAVADLDVARASSQLATAGWHADAFSAMSLGDALKTRRTHVTPDAEALIACPEIEVVVEATGVPPAGIRHALGAIAHGKHIVMVNVEADAVAGPLLARKAKAASVVYSLAWGDQPALICEHVDWARACGFNVIAAGKGTRYEPHYHRSTPDTVWDILDKYLKIEDRKSINPKMFNSFIDGTKSGIEMTAVCNATGLVPQSEGLGFPPATRFELAEVCKPKSAGGTLEKAGVTEVVSSVYRDGRDVTHHLALGTYVVFALPADPHDRPRARRVGRERRLARGTDRRAHWLSLRRCGDRQARAAERRGARRRRRLLRLGQAGSGRALSSRRIPAARTCPRGQARARRRRRRMPDLERRRLRPERSRDEGAPRDGSRVRPAECFSAPILRGTHTPRPGFESPIPCRLR
jgi:predicted homoserine dehydrogenase-like protein